MAGFSAVVTRTSKFNISFCKLKILKILKNSHTCTVIFAMFASPFMVEYESLKVSYKGMRKSKLELPFLHNSKSINVFLKVLCFHLPENTNRNGVLAIRRLLLLLFFFFEGKKNINKQYKDVMMSLFS